MVPIDRVPKPRPHNVGINLGGRDIGVPQHHLHAAEIGAAFQEMCGKTMTEYVGGQSVENAGPPAITGEQLPESLPGKTAAARGNEQVAAGAPLEQSAAAGLQIALHRLEGYPTDGHEPAGTVRPWPASAE